MRSNNRPPVNPDPPNAIVFPADIATVPTPFPKSTPSLELFIVMLPLKVTSPFWPTQKSAPLLALELNTTGPLKVVKLPAS